MKKQKVTIKNPCHLKWDDLTLLEGSKDRHCNECAMNIKDFRGMTNNEIISYLTENSGKKVCSVMRSEEHKSKNKIQSTVKGWYHRVNSNPKGSYFKPFFLFCITILMFSTGCKDDDDFLHNGETVVEEIEPVEKSITIQNNN